MAGLESLDRRVITGARVLAVPFARMALFIVYFWFGVLKLVDSSPANPLVAALLERTLPFITFNHFIIFLGCAEMLIAVAFIVPGLERWALALLVPHMITTIMPLFLLPSVTWQAPLVPTLEGQYIIKNLLIIAAALVIVSRAVPGQAKRLKVSG